jgi:predicted transcriptional regulator
MPPRSVVREKVLEALRMGAGELVPQSYIHKSLKISRSRVSEILGELEREGLISRVKVGNQYLIKLLDFRGEPPSRLRVFHVGLVWSSEYPFLTIFAKKVKEELNAIIKIVVFTSSIQATKALVLGDLELALTPTITQLHFYSAFKNFRIIGGGAYGGSKVLVKDSASAHTTYSSELSTMDLVRSLSMREGIIPADTLTRYFRSPEEILKAISAEAVKYAVVWHPIYRRLERAGYREVLRSEDLEVMYCCTLAASTVVPEETRRVLSKVYRESLEEYRKAPERWVDWYSLQVGIPRDVVLDGVREYKVNPVLNKVELRKYAGKIPVEIPSADTVLNEVLETEE